LALKTAKLAVFLTAIPFFGIMLQSEYCFLSFVTDPKVGS